MLKISTEELLNWNAKKKNGEKNKVKKSERKIQELCDNFKRYNIHVIGIPEGEKRETEAKEIYKARMAENFTKSLTDTAWSTLSRINNNNYITMPIISKLQKTEDKEKILKEARGGKTPCL